MSKIVLSSDHLPPGLSNRQRLARWHDLYRENRGGRGEPTEFGASDAPFAARIELVPIGAAFVGRMSGTLNRVLHGDAKAKASHIDRFGLILSTSDAPLRLRHRHREMVIAPGEVALISTQEAGEITSAGNYSSWMLLEMPKPAILPSVPGAENLVAAALNVGGETLRMISSYANLVMQQNITRPLLGDHVSRTLTDLASLMLGAKEQAAETARQRGLKAARLDAVLRQITSGFTDPEFDIAVVASRLRLSVRYVQDLLQATGSSFSDRVLELRLQHSCELLARANATRRKVSDIAYSSGFNDLSYFHRCFRRRFGMTPGGARST